MDDASRVDDYFEIEPQEAAAPDPGAAQARLPRLVADQTYVMQLQLFDNSSRMKRGRSRYALKIEAYYRAWDVKLCKPDFWRVVQLIEPAKVLSWARKGHGRGGMDDGTLSLYEEAAAALEAKAADSGVAWARMGHIGDPTRGKHYYVGQFALAIMFNDGELCAAVQADGRLMPCLKFLKDKKSSREGARALYGFYDPLEILKRQREAELKLRERGRA